MNNNIKMEKNKKRVFLCGMLNFPHNSAGANYIQHLALAYANLGFEVHIVADINNEHPHDYVNRNGLILDAIKISKIKGVRTFDLEYGFLIKTAIILNRYRITNKDIIIAYSRKRKLLELILHIGKDRGAKTGACVVEWYGREDVSSDKEYARSEKVFSEIYPKFDFVISISRYIHDYFLKKGIASVCIPCMADINEFPKEIKKYSGKRKFIYPANGKMKDALDQMLNAIINLPQEYLERSEFHFCGIQKETAMDLTNERILHLFETKNVIFHSWLNYEQLVDLYQQMHFLLLMRKKSRMTMANFPSKVPETMVYGVTPVCTDVGDYTKTYLENGKSAIIVIDSETDTITTALKYAIDLSWENVKEYNRQSRIVAEKRFDYHNWLKTIDEM